MELRYDGDYVLLPLSTEVEFSPTEGSGEYSECELDSGLGMCALQKKKKKDEKSELLS